eukprot:11143938-Alexandrium_andersonii.AAC.1
MLEAPREARRLPRLAVKQGGLPTFADSVAAERAVWPAGHAGTVAPSGWILGSELTLTRHRSDRLGVPT